MDKKKKRVLIVENNMVLSLLYENYMEKLGCSVIDSLVYGKNAVEKVRTTNPDLIIMDILLDGPMDGIEAMEEIRTFSDVPVIYITGNSDGNKLKRARATGYIDFLEKPISFDHLKGPVHKALNAVKDKS